MSTFVELTPVHGDGAKIWVNVDQVLSFTAAYKGGTVVMVGSGDGGIKVRETPDEIMDRLPAGRQR